MKMSIRNDLADRCTWYYDYIRMTDDTKLKKRHFIKDFIFQHRVRYMVYLRISQNTKKQVYKAFLRI